MTYYGAKELAASFRTVRKNTLTIAEEIGEEHYGFSPAPGTKTVAQTLTHIAVITKMPEAMHGANRVQTLVGLNFMAIMGPLMAEEGKSRNKAEIVALLKENGDSFANLLEGMSEEALAEQVTMPPGATPESKSRLEMLLGAKEHEMHHRGQLMVMERMLGMTPHLTREMQARMAQMQAAAKA
jgi:uncharacterized damage-inducible protein DinB